MQSTFKNKFAIKLFGLLFILAASLQGCYISQPVSQPVVHREIVPPPWAPAYQNPSMVQYYYMPDIEVYYDVWNHEYVYLENGNWIFEPGLPPMYSGYDLYGGHVVVLNYNVHEPWRHHEIYSSHYPKYYYHSVHGGDNGEHSTGFDENTNQHYYGPRTNSPSTGGNNQRPNNSPPPSTGSHTNVAPPNQPRNNSAPPRNEYEKPVNPVNPIRPERQEPNYQPRKTQPVQYKEKTVGQPVKVQKNMTRPKAVPETKNPAAPNREIKR